MTPPERSRLRLELDHLLTGVRATLEAALRDHPDDPARDQAEALLATIAAALDADDGTVSSDSTSSAATLPLDLSTVLDDGELASTLGPAILAGDEPWASFQRLLLRASPAVRERLATAAERLAQAQGRRLDSRRVERLHHDRDDDELVFPGLSGGDGGAVERGLRLTRSAALPDAVADAVADCRDPEIELLASVVTTHLYLLAREPQLHHAHRKLGAPSLVHLVDDGVRTAYHRELVESLRRAAATTTDPHERVLRRLELDEAIHSLLFVPPAAAESWWSRQRTIARATLRSVFRDNDFWRELKPGTPYKEVARFANRDSDPKVEVGGAPGEVVACLRVYARVAGESLPGRVVFRSLKR